MSSLTPSTLKRKRNSSNVANSHRLSTSGPKRAKARRKGPGWGPAAPASTSDQDGGTTDALELERLVTALKANYSMALSALSHSDALAAQQGFQAVLESPLWDSNSELPNIADIRDPTVLHTLARIRYGTLKQTAVLAGKAKSFNTALVANAAALSVDPSDPLLWATLAKSATKDEQYPLAAQASALAAEALPHHFPTAWTAAQSALILGDVWSFVHFLSSSQQVALIAQSNPHVQATLHSLLATNHHYPPIPALVVDDPSLRTKLEALLAPQPPSAAKASSNSPSSSSPPQPSSSFGTTSSLSLSMEQDVIGVGWMEPMVVDFSSSSGQGASSSSSASSSSQPAHEHGPPSQEVLDHLLELISEREEFLAGQSIAAQTPIELTLPAATWVAVGKLLLDAAREAQSSKGSANTPFKISLPSASLNPAIASSSSSASTTASLLDDANGGNSMAAPPPMDPLGLDTSTSDASNHASDSRSTPSTPSASSTSPSLNQSSSSRRGLSLAQALAVVTENPVEDFVIPALPISPSDAQESSDVMAAAAPPGVGVEEWVRSWGAGNHGLVAALTGWMAHVSSPDFPHPWPKGLSSIVRQVDHSGLIIGSPSLGVAEAWLDAAEAASAASNAQGLARALAAAYAHLDALLLPQWPPESPTESFNAARHASIAARLIPLEGSEESPDDQGEARLLATNALLAALQATPQGTVFTSSSKLTAAKVQQTLRRLNFSTAPADAEAAAVARDWSRVASILKPLLHGVEAPAMHLFTPVERAKLHVRLFQGLANMPSTTIADKKASLLNALHNAVCLDLAPSLPSPPPARSLKALDRTFSGWCSAWHLAHQADVPLTFCQGITHFAPSSSEDLEAVKQLSSTLGALLLVRTAPSAGTGFISSLWTALIHVCLSIRAEEPLPPSEILGLLVLAHREVSRLSGCCADQGVAMLCRDVFHVVVDETDDSVEPPESTLPKELQPDPELELSQALACLYDIKVPEFARELQVHQGARIGDFESKELAARVYALLAPIAEDALDANVGVKLLVKEALAKVLKHFPDPPNWPGIEAFDESLVAFVQENRPWDEFSVAPTPEELNPVPNLYYYAGRMASAGRTDPTDVDAAAGHFRRAICCSPTERPDSWVYLGVSLSALWFGSLDAVEEVKKTGTTPTITLEQLEPLHGHATAALQVAVNSNPDSVKARETAAYISYSKIRILARREQWNAMYEQALASVAAWKAHQQLDPHWRSLLHLGKVYRKLHLLTTTPICAAVIQAGRTTPPVDPQDKEGSEEEERPLHEDPASGTMFGVLALQALTRAIEEAAAENPAADTSTFTGLVSAAAPAVYAIHATRLKFVLHLARGLSTLKPSEATHLSMGLAYHSALVKGTEAVSKVARAAPEVGARVIWDDAIAAITTLAAAETKYHRAPFRVWMAIVSAPWATPELLDIGREHLMRLVGLTKKDKYLCKFWRYHQDAETGAQFNRLRTKYLCGVLSEYIQAKDISPLAAVSHRFRRDGLVHIDVEVGLCRALELQQMLMNTPQDQVEAVVGEYLSMSTPEDILHELFELLVMEVGAHFSSAVCQTTEPEKEAQITAASRLQKAFLGFGRGIDLEGFPEEVKETRIRFHEEIFVLVWKALLPALQRGYDALTTSNTASKYHRLVLCGKKCDRVPWPEPGDPGPDVALSHPRGLPGWLVLMNELVSLASSRWPGHSAKNIRSHYEAQMSKHPLPRPVVVAPAPTIAPQAPALGTSQVPAQPLSTVTVGTSSSSAAASVRGVDEAALQKARDLLASMRAAATSGTTVAPPPPPATTTSAAAPVVSAAPAAPTDALVAQQSVAAPVQSTPNDPAASGDVVTLERGVVDPPARSLPTDQPVGGADAQLEPTPMDEATTNPP